MNNSTTPDLTQLMANLGPLVGAAEILEVEPNLWMIAFDDEFAIVVEYDEAIAKLVLHTELGQPATGNELDTYKLLLNVATLWRETGGLRMGLNPVDDTVMQIIDFPVAGLELDDLQTYVQNFANTALHARAVIAAEADTDPNSFHSSMNLLRV